MTIRFFVEKYCACVIGDVAEPQVYTSLKVI